jgi:hypothetical protein
MTYVNATINQGGFGSFQCDVAGDITLYQRLVFTTNASSAGGKPCVKAAAATDRAIGVAMQPFKVGTFGNVRLLNAQGEQFGQASGTIGLGVTVYQAASGKLTAASGGGALLAGVSTTPGYDGGPFTYMQQPNYA